ncbi:MAG: ABC transporter permease, partial [bacterium]|nr:ABC transporter permease [bacterium]
MNITEKIFLERIYLNRFLSGTRLRMIIGDFVEEYNDMRIESGFLKAKLWFWFQLLKATPSLFSLTTFRSLMMLKNYLKITFRNFRRHKGYSLINILGLAIGMASCMLILLWVFDELSYDRFHENADNIYMLYDKKEMNNGNVNYSTAHPFPVHDEFLKSYPEVDKITRAFQAYVQISSGNKSFSSTGMIVDPSFLEIFTFPLISGDMHTALNDPNAIVLTEETAGKLFGNKDPIGETVTIQGSTAMIVSGIVETITENSTITFDFLRSTTAGDDLPVATNWGTSTWMIYMSLYENVAEEDFEEKITNFYIERNQGGDSQPFLQPLTDVHLYSLAGGGPIIYV